MRQKTTRQKEEDSLGEAIFLLYYLFSCVLGFMKFGFLAGVGNLIIPIAPFVWFIGNKM